MNIVILVFMKLAQFCWLRSFKFSFKYLPLNVTLNQLYQDLEIFSLIYEPIFGMSVVKIGGYFARVWLA